MTNASRLSFLWAILPVLCLCVNPAWADEEGTQLKSIAEQSSPMICTVKAVLKMDMSALGGPVQDQNVELQGAVVDKSGLVMLSNSQLVGQSMEMMGMSIDIKITPVDIKVVFENEAEEYPAFLASKDTDLSLAFVQIEDLKGRELTALEFAKDTKVQVGEKLASVSRLGKGYDYAPYFMTGRVTGKIKKPYRAHMVEGSMGAAMGLPLMNMQGQVVGVVTTLKGAEASGGSANPFAGIAQMGTPFVISAKMIAGKIGQAKDVAAQTLAERKASEETAEPTDGETPPDDEAGGTDGTGGDDEGDL